MGAGTVGTSIAELLCGFDVSVSVVDSNQASLDRVREGLDVQAVHGSACEATAMFQSGVQSAELVLAVTGRDEVNLVGASIAKAMGARRSVARVYDPGYRDYSTFDYQSHFNIDRLLSLEQLTALELAKVISAPGVFAVENFARGGVQVLEVAVDSDASAAGKQLRELKLPAQVRVGLIATETKTFIPRAEDAVSPGDHVTLVGKADDLQQVKRQFERRSRARLNVIIAGGGEVGFHLARTLRATEYNIVVLEHDKERCNYLANRLPNVTVLNADTTRRGELEEARVGNADVFVASTGRDEDNIICGVEAKELGAKRIVGIVRRPDYVNVLEKLGIDVAVSPREVLAREVVGMVSGGPILGQSEIGDGAAVVCEMEVVPGSPVTDRPLKDLHFSGALVIAIITEEYVRVAGADDQLKTGQTAVLLVQKDRLKDTVALFTPAA